MNKQGLLLYNKILTYCSFIIASLVVVATFMTATTYAQLVLAILLYPLLVFFAFKVFPRKMKVYSKKEVNSEPSEPVELTTEVEAKKEKLDVADIDKRVFLKLVGGIGFSLLLYSIFNKKVEGLFSKSLPGSGDFSLRGIDGNKINPAQSQPTDGYRLSEIDDGAIAYYGFIKQGGNWYIMKVETDIGSIRYTRGDFNLPRSWANRENLKYDYFSNIFKN